MLLIDIDAFPNNIIANHNCSKLPLSLRKNILLSDVYYGFSTFFIRNILIEIVRNIYISQIIINMSQYFFGYIGVASALVFANLGAAYGSAKAGVGICSMGVLKPELIMKSVVPVVMAGIFGIYGMIVALIIVQRSNL